VPLSILGWCPPNVADLRGVAVQHLK
jgi:hypothetical protein